MKIRFLGTGTSQGVPMIGCACAVCQSNNPKNHRCRTHIHVEMGGLNIQVDAAQEFRLQAVAYRIPKIDLVLLTHGHADHILGFDDLRRYCDQREGRALPVYTNEEGLERLQSIYPYAIRERSAVRGYPAFAPALMPSVLDLGDAGKVYSTTQSHGSFTTLGLIFHERHSGKRFAYYTDCDHVSPEARELARKADVVVLDGLRSKPHASHMNIEMALEAAADINAASSFLIHMTHEIDHEIVESTLPPKVRLAYDGLLLEL